jgi:hypothetical protein
VGHRFSSLRRQVSRLARKAAGAQSPGSAELVPRPDDPGRNPAAARPRTARPLASGLCGWAEAVAEALAYAPSRVAAVLGDAAAGSPWRATLGLNEPSDPLRNAIQLMADVVSNTAATSDHLGAVLAAVSDDIASAEDTLTGIVRRVLLAALELREGRRRHEQDHRAT